MMRARVGTRLLVAAAAATLVLAAASTVAVAAATGAFRSGRDAPSGVCSAPNLPGTTVDVSVTDMGGRMGMGQWGGGMMRVLVSRSQVSAGTVSFRVADTGRLVHELVVLPLPPGQHAGERPVGSDGGVDETASLGEASRSCGAGEGDGIDPGAIGWATVTLPAGDYELICNLPGHYAAGMYARLHVT